ncbi:hypothetical protein Trydic_g12762 [Trypoxylus dichotomus]
MGLLLLGGIISWLIDNKVSFSQSMLKAELYQLVQYYNSNHIQYTFDKLFVERGHTVLRFPPYYPDLNPVELIWATVKGNVAKRNITFTITSEYLQSICNHAIIVEKKYMEQEILTDVAAKKLIINPNEDNSSDHVNWESDEDE